MGHPPLRAMNGPTDVKPAGHDATDGATERRPVEVSSPGDKQDRFIADLDAFSVDDVHADTAEVERWIPHRHEMRLLDRVCWLAPDQRAAAGIAPVRSDAFWARGHFPERAIMPGVLQIEAAAQLGVYLFNVRCGGPRTAVFLRIESAAFRRAVYPPSDLLLLAAEVRIGRRRFELDIQGVTLGELAFEARISGMIMSDSMTS